MGEIQNKIRIFSLAKDLGMDSKVLIKHCNDAGVPVKSSALAAISPEEKQIVLDYIASKTRETAKKPTPVPELTPPRDAARDAGGRVRNLRDMSPRERAKSSEVTTAAPQEAPVEEAPEPQVTSAPVAVVAEEPVLTEPVVTPTPVEVAAEVSEPEVPPTPESEAVTEVVIEEETPPEPEAVAPAKPQPEAPPAKPAPMKREDYIAPHGSARVVREMTARGGSTGRLGRGDRSQPVGPVLAEMPNYKVKEQPKSSNPGSKVLTPEVKLTTREQYDAQQLLQQQGPLAKQMHKSPDEKKAAAAAHPPKKKEVGVAHDVVPGRGKAPTEEADAPAKKPRRDRRNSSVPSEDDEGMGSRKRHGISGGRRKHHKQQAELKTHATVALPVTVRRLSEAIGRPVKSIIGSLFKRGQMVTINDTLESEVAWEVAAELGVELEVEQDKSVDEELAEIFDQESSPEALRPRPPIVTILGHVDHGKTTLLDKIRSTNVAAGEAGGITQHIRAYQIFHKGQPITFVDTPGHAAFGEMRARGANVTDMVVLVVAANDSVMPQTVECISHAKAAGAPIIVAMNKWDLPEVREMKVLTDLSTHGVQPHEWGGDVEVVRTSGLSGEGLDQLLETILLTAELNELKADPSRDAVGLCMEGFRDEGRGAIAWIIVQKGTLKVGDVMLCGSTFGRIRSMYNDRGQEVKEAAPSMPVKVTGLNDVPGAGDRFYVLDDVELARTIAEERMEEGRQKTLARRNKPRTLDDILNSARDGAIQDLNLIVKADTPGSLEALRHEIGKFEHPEVRVRVLHEAVGGVNESDVYLASASDAVIIAFHVIAEDRATSLAEQEGVEIRRYDIIYEVTDEIKRTLEGLLLPEKVKVSTGRAIVLQTFSIGKIGTIAGCRVLSGTIERSNRVSVIRDQKVMNDYPLASLRRVKDDVKEVREGMECGIRLEGFNDVKEGDLLEAFRIDSVKRTLD